MKTYLFVIGNSDFVISADTHLVEGQVISIDKKPYMIKGIIPVFSHSQFSHFIVICDDSENFDQNINELISK